MPKCFVRFAACDTGIFLNKKYSKFVCIALIFHPKNRIRTHDPCPTNSLGMLTHHFSFCCAAVVAQPVY